MTSIMEAGSAAPVLDEVNAQLKDYTGQEGATLEGAAQLATDLFYEEFCDSVVLVRVFATVPFGRLPAFNRSFVTELAKQHDIADLMHDDTPVLSLVGTRGAEPAWNDRRQSEGHVGIPLASTAFISRIPMMSRLLTQIGFDLEGIDSQAIDIRTLAGLSGVFYVPDGATAVDALGRKIISAQDFVSSAGVKTVFGLAGSYPSGQAFLTLIAFCRQTIEKSRAERLLPLMSRMVLNTKKLVANGTIFA